MKLLNQLSESQIFRSKSAVERLTARKAADLLHMHICGLTILALSPTSTSWAKDYARRTINHGGFSEWRTNSTDLGILGWSLLTEDIEFRLPTTSNKLRERLTLDDMLLMRWLKSIVTGGHDIGLIHRLFARLDIALKIDDESLRAIRRLVQDWKDLDTEEASLCLTRLLQLFRSYAAQSELLRELDVLAKQFGLELHDVSNPETGETRPEHDEPHDHEPKKTRNLFAQMAAVAAGGVLGYKIAKHHQVQEDATVGATSADCIAPVVGAFGGVQRRPMPSTIAIPEFKKRKTKKKPK